MDVTVRVGRMEGRIMVAPLSIRPSWWWWCGGERLLGLWHKFFRAEVVKSQAELPKRLSRMSHLTV